jgi:hypothetical protein
VNAASTIRERECKAKDGLELIDADDLRFQMLPMLRLLLRHGDDAIGGAGKHLLVAFEDGRGSGRGPSREAAMKSRAAGSFSRLPARYRALPPWVRRRGLDLASDSLPVRSKGVPVSSRLAKSVLAAGEMRHCVFRSKAATDSGGKATSPLLPDKH